MISLVLWSAFAVLCGVFLYRKGRENEDFFQKWKIKYSRPEFMFGHSRKMWLRKQTFYEFHRELYQEFPEEKAIGAWDMRTPVTLLRDLQLIKQFTVKEFDSFTDHKIMFDESMDSLMGNVLVVLSGDKWRKMRSTLSPAFTGSKMRAMFHLTNAVSRQLISALKEQSLSSETQIMEFDGKDLCSKYTNDVIALCAFGIEIDTLRNPKNVFYSSGNALMRPGIEAIIGILILRFVPKVFKLFNMKIVDSKTRAFFSGMVLDTMRIREEKNIRRNDMIDLLRDALRQEDQKDGKGGKPQWTDDEVVAQCLMFFLAGFDTSSTVMTLAMYELVANPEVQEKLYEEIRSWQDHLEADENGREISYDDLRELKYLEMVVNETLRKWPPAAMTDRVCNRSFDLKDEETGLEMHLKKGDSVWVPIYGIQMDPKYHEEPQRFNPERFSEENKEKMNPDTFLPFGSGPRICIANRFAMMEIKALLYHVILNFELVPTKKTNLPVKVQNFMNSISKDIFFGLQERK